MCGNIVKISSQSDYQWIGICSHGSVHVYWRSLQVFISKNKLESLNRSALEGSLPVEEYGDDYLFWLNKVAIKLTQEDYIQLLELFAYADDGCVAAHRAISRNSSAKKVLLH